MTLTEQVVAARAEIARLRDIPVHTFDCDWWNMYNDNSRQGSCDCEAMAMHGGLLNDADATLDRHGVNHYCSSGGSYGFYGNRFCADALAVLNRFAPLR